ncbi:MAG: DUF2974 domain-containing protein [Agathobacter sp.]|nr:DUF2974 domain-containing protein [Agathobacter sp.]
MQYKDNFLTYIKWRGDLLIKDHPFNEVDALILSELVYIHFEGIVPVLGEEGCITIQEAGKKYRRSDAREMLYYKDKEDLFEELAMTPRFSTMTLCNYVSTLDIEAQQQFAAMHINVAPNLTFIAFRGTDSTVTGWREDFNMSYMMPVPAQQSAVDYVNQTAKGMFKKYWIGGHSKGGNLAIYSGVFCNPKIQKKIVRINSFDGPGFNQKMIDDAAYRLIEDKIATYVPESSIVGMLMEHEEDYKVVQSAEFGLLQHEGFSWLVERDTFVFANEVHEFSKSFSVTLKNWLAGMSTEQRKGVVDAFFDVFEQAGIHDFMEIADMDVKTAGALIKAVAKVPQEHRERMGKLIKLLIEESMKK